jgi:hypothetical protein
MELGALVKFILHGDVAAVLFHYFLAQGQPYASAFVFFVAMQSYEE